MPDDAFDWQKVYFLLRDVERTSRSRPARIALRPTSEGPAWIGGEADRPGLIALGLNIAVSGLEAGTSIAIRADGTVGRGEDARLIAIRIVDPRPSPVPPGRGRRWRTWLRGLVGASLIVLSLIGLRTVAEWLAG